MNQNQNQTSASEMHHDKLTQSNYRMDEDENKLLTQITQLDSVSTHQPCLEPSISELAILH